MFSISRRAALRLAFGGLAAAADFRPRKLFARDTSGDGDKVRVGAIRWDAWYAPDMAPGSSEWHAAHGLDPAKYHHRAPFFAEKIGTDRMFISGTQASMDAEISYAAKAGISYWAFGWYQFGRPLRKGWEYYQLSEHNALVNWCALIGLGSLAGNFPPTADLVRYFQYENYEKFGDRPLLYVMHDKSPLPAAARALDALRAACAAAGVGNPYVIAQSSVAKLGALDARGIGADAIGAYASAPAMTGGPIPYATLDAFVRKFWLEMAATGLPVVPNAMTGWDRRPRIERPPPFDPLHLNPDDYVIPGTPKDIAAHIEAAVAFVRAHRGTCEANNVLVYSWNECDEGGSVLCPTWSENGVDHSRLDAVARVLKQAQLL
ncbi:hypothetical protein [Bradyrhizobium prioriisuperbiae]|uniref:hypothetical protein n=1 Tax=Bradyrhizobium prioriisuperbiae TaxID=2854389 RepID=UPI0028E726AA|nr:hypothetical protein [Bradyrhizobium prioritasuperba]